jgi:hypothetical protein
VKHIKEIFIEYTRMRTNGMDAKSVLNVLRPHVESLSKIDREQLAGMIRDHESKSSTGTYPVAREEPSPAAQAAPPPPAAPAPSRRIQPLKPVTPPGKAAEPPPQPVPSQPTSAAAPAEADEVIWINCPHCGKTNQRHEVFCYACGQLLEPVKGAFDTRLLSEKTVEPLDSEFFGPESVLVLRVRGSAETFESRPQKSDHEIIIGRGTKGSVLAPDIDLSSKQATDLGVSRLHLSISYDAPHNAILIADLGSANGSYLNGQRMMAREVRVLRHGDELRLGKLVLMVSFRHPGTPTA